MARPKAKAPARRYHLSGQSVVTLDGKDFYLGPHDSPESIARYAVLIAIYQQSGFRLPDDLDFDQDVILRAAAMIGHGIQAMPANQERQPVLVKHVTSLFREHVAEKYAKEPKEKHRHERICDAMEQSFGDVKVDDFGPVRLKEFRQGLLDQEKKLARKYVNRLTNCVVSVFRYGVSVELVDVAVVQRLQTLEPLRYGQTTAPEKPAVVAVNLDHVRATAKHLSPVVKTMIRVQVATGMRPIELFRMRPCDIDRTGEVWIYSPSTHKTERTGKPKLIPLLGDAREAITDYLGRDPKAYLFSPAESMAWRRAVGRANRKTPLKYGNSAGTNRKQNPKRLPRHQFDGASYRQAIRRAAQKAGVPHWHPYQLRHLTATVVRAALGNLEDAQALLGHSTALMTAHYAAESIESATKAAKVAPHL